jgi:cholesterol oxidase
MLGVAEVETDDPADELLREYGREIGAADTYAKTRVGVFFGEPGVTVPDPYFGGAGPERAGCIRCGRCMVGCPHNAKMPASACSATRTCSSATARRSRPTSA